MGYPHPKMLNLLSRLAVLTFLNTYFLTVMDVVLIFPFASYALAKMVWVPRLILETFNLYSHVVVTGTDSV